MSTAARFPTITPEALAALRARIGRPVRRPEAYIEVATRDAIRHWAHGIGDRNPFWAEQGVRLFRVDNPHTKPLPFWEWLIGEVQRWHPDVIFLSEAFTRP